MQRRNFLAKGILASTSALLLSGCTKEDSESKSVNIIKRKPIKIRLATSWPAAFPIMGEGVERFAKNVNSLSGGSIDIKIYPKNTLVPALGVFDAVSSGSLDAYHSASYYYKGKNEAFSLFTGFPFGMTSLEMSAWMDFGNGMKLWRELYDRYNLIPFKGGNTGVQMGGWFKKKIESLEDLKGLKMRIPGLGGEVFARLGVKPILLPAGEIYVSLERNMIDATEWLGPSLDTKMGFHKVAKYYYSGWHEPGSMLSLVFNKHKFSKFSDEQKQIIQICSNEMNSYMQTQFQYENARALEILHKSKVTIEKLPNDVLQAAKKAMKEVVKEKSQKSIEFEKIWLDAKEFLDQNRSWTKVGLKAYLNIGNSY
jgi:TRAP-type mannitol/chloroaromatic compound transport system substrate-binding protein